MTATDELRRLLVERGVKWEDMSIRPYACTSWRDPDGEPCTALEGADDIPDGKLSAQALLTPEQAVEATLGHAYEPPLAAHWDGDTLTLTIPRDPSCIRVQRSAEQPCKVYADESKVIAATLGRRTCHLISAPQYGEGCQECSACGEVLDGYLFDGGRCPRCGAKVVEK